MKPRLEEMTCEGCVTAVTKAVRRIAPYASVAIDLTAGIVIIEAAIPPTQFAAAIESAGFAVAGQVV